GLQRIETEVRVGSGATFRPVRKVELGYSTEAPVCDGGHGTPRLLTSIQETATSPEGVATTRPAITFDYGPLTRSLSKTRTFDTPAGNYTHTLAHGGRTSVASNDETGFTTIESMLLDLDGDGRPDRLSRVPLESGCAFAWQRNLG